MITAATHISIFVSNQDEALKFYTEKLGFKVDTDTLFGDMRWLTINAPNQKNFFVALYEAKTPQDKALIGKQGGTCPLLCLETNDIENDYKEMKAQGIEFTDTIENHPWGKAVTLKDLYGNHLYIVQPSQ